MIKITRTNKYFVFFIVTMMFASFISVSAAGTPSYSLSESYKIGITDADGRELPRPPKPSKKYTIGALIPMIANPHFVAQAYGYLDEGEQLGVEVLLFAIEGYQFVDKQIQQIEDLITMGVDAICLVAASADGTVPIVNRTVDAGIPVINVNVMTNSEKVSTQIRSEDEEIGRIQAKYHEKMLNGQGNVLMINGIPGTSWAIYRSKGYREYIQTNVPGIKILDERWCDNSPEAALKEVDDALQVYDKIDAIYTPGELFATGAVQALEGAGKLEDTLITSVDPSPEGVALMKAGKIDMMVVQSSVTQGRWGIRAAINILEGRAAETYKKYWSPLWVVNGENADEFEFLDVNAPPEGWKLPL